MAFFTAAVERPPFFAEIPVCFVHGLVLATQLARFLPLVIDEKTAAMQPFVCGLRDELEIVDSVIEFVIVSMMDVISGWNGSVDKLPHQHMLHALPFLDRIVDPAVTLLSDVPVSAISF
jgi:hypothetical protein